MSFNFKYTFINSTHIKLTNQQVSSQASQKSFQSDDWTAPLKSYCAPYFHLDHKT